MQLRKVKRIAVVVTLLIPTIFLSSCSSVPKTVTYQSAPIDKPSLILPDATVLALRDIDFVIVTLDNMDEVMLELQKVNSNIALFALTDIGYENLSLNNADILKLVAEQKSIIAAYKSYYEDINTNVDNYNDNRDVTIPVLEDAGITDKVLGLFNN
jgi:PBP1b-binding outer membrane lipoprotein LpoB